MLATLGSLLTRFAEDHGVALGTLRNYRDTAAAWPDDARRRASSFSVYVELRHREDRFDLIRDGMTVSAARAAAGQQRRTSDPQRPVTVEQVKDAEEFGRHVKQGGWRLGLLVARNVERGTHRDGPVTTVTGDGKVSAREFARAGGTSAPLVLRHLDAWERAAAA